MFGQSISGSGVCHGPKGWGPNPEKSSPEGWGPDFGQPFWLPGKGGPLSFFPLPPQFSFSLSVVFSWNFDVFEGRDAQMCTFGLTGCRVKPRRLCGLAKVGRIRMAKVGLTKVVSARVSPLAPQEADSDTPERHGRAIAN